MGWTYSYRPKGISHLDWFAEQFGDGRSGGRGVIDAAGVGGFHGEVYMAYRTEKDDIVALICLIHWVPNTDYNFGYKDMDETMGANETRCPERILNQLTSTNNEQALEWRQACRLYHTQRKARPRLTRGAIVHFKEPIIFASGISKQKLIVVDARRLLFSDIDTKWSRYKLRRDSLELVETITYPPQTHRTYRCTINSVLGERRHTMKALPRVKQDEMKPGLFYISGIRPSKNMNDGCTDPSEMHFYGPVGGLQLTYTLLRNPTDGEVFGWYDTEQSLWTIAQPENNDQRWFYSDIFLTFTTKRPDRDLAVADALGDVLDCGQECLCPTCRQDIEWALDLVESGVDDTEKTS